jgi:FAD/FMN-containing dehydrogenase
MNELLSWGRFPRSFQCAANAHWLGDLQTDLNATAKQHQSILAYGNGRSYGDSCLSVSNQVLRTTSMNRFIEANWETGEITAQAGLTFGEILSVSVARGWFLPVTPGTKYLTLGGAVANDVHGKNHLHHGTFGCHVKAFSLCRTDRPEMVCSEFENFDFFGATIGGLGLTGVIGWVKLQLLRINSSDIDVTNIRFDSLEGFCRLSDELDLENQYSVAWIDCASSGKSLGRGIYSIGNHSSEGPLFSSSKTKFNVPFVPPISAINRFSLKAFNAAYFHRQSPNRSTSRTNYEPFFYPLDSIRNWNRIYGPRGFQQYQCALPSTNAQAGIKEMLQEISKQGQGSFLAVLKRFGSKLSPGLLSFPIEGLTLALDFPEQGRATTRLFERLDEIVRLAKGRQYPAKDAHMRGEDFRNAYPEWEKIEKLRDPHLLSQFWKRTTQV